jgi:hypothetical protein
LWESNEIIQKTPSIRGSRITFSWAERVHRKITSYLTLDVLLYEKLAWDLIDMINAL